MSLYIGKDALNKTVLHLTSDVESKSTLLNGVNPNTLMHSTLPFMEVIYIQVIQTNFLFNQYQYVTDFYAFNSEGLDAVNNGAVPLLFIENNGSFETASSYKCTFEYTSTGIRLRSSYIDTSSALVYELLHVVFITAPTTNLTGIHIDDSEILVNGSSLARMKLLTVTPTYSSTYVPNTLDDKINIKSFSTTSPYLLGNSSEKVLTYINSKSTLGAPYSLQLTGNSIKQYAYDSASNSNVLIFDPFRRPALVVKTLVLNNANVSTFMQSPSASNLVQGVGLRTYTPPILPDFDFALFRFNIESPIGIFSVYCVYTDPNTAIILDRAIYNGMEDEPYNRFLGFGYNTATKKFEIPYLNDSGAYKFDNNSSNRSDVVLNGGIILFKNGY